MLRQSHPTPPPVSSLRICEVYRLGIVPYAVAWEWQKQWVRDAIAQPDLPDRLLLLEHPSVYTLGQGATLDYLKFESDSPDYELHRTERGGEVTYHTPGQLVGYPILNLNFYQRDLHWYLRQLEAVLIQTLQVYGLVGERIPGLTGVWVEGYKVAAIGIKVSRWITMHGFALNICPDLSGFSHIVPCGIRDRPVGCLAQFMPDLQVATVQTTLEQCFAEVFGIHLVSKEKDWHTFSPESSLKSLR
jgi:lipoyl(octanoyl) transferase